MSQTRYCSTCGTLLSHGAAICGECGARYQASPYERRATDTPGAWSQAPTPRGRDLGTQEEQATDDDGIELISRESLTPRKPGATALRTAEQYDQLMATPSPMHQTGPGSAPGMPSGPGSPVPAPDAPAAEQQMEPPLDGCTPATPLKRFLAALIDSVISTLVAVPFMIGLFLVLTAEEVGLLPLILIGVGVALPVAYLLLIIWLVGAKGFSLGKLILGLRIASTTTGGAIGFLRSLGRWFLYGLIPLLMALSIFIDPKKQLRGIHDRAIGSVVVDVTAGRNPFKERPDDFERAGAEHYLGEPSVAVSAHENLLSEPGAAWKSSGSAPAQPAASGAWGGDQQVAPSPYAPPSSASDAPGFGAAWSSPPPAQETSAAPQGADGGWAPPPVDPVPAPQQPQPWDQPVSQQPRSWDRPAAQQPPQSWGAPAPEQQAPQQSWDRPQAPESSAPREWAPPVSHHDQFSAPRPPYAEPATTQGAVGDHTQSYDSDPADGGWDSGAGSQQPSGAPSDLTGDAWYGGDDVDEQTRMSLPDASMADLEQTRISAARLPAVKKLRLTTDDGAERIVERAVVIGRNPSAPGDEVLFVLKDDTRSVSKTHLRIDGTGDDVTVTDLGSTNGSTILREDGSRENLVPGSPTVLPSGAQVTLGDRTLSVEREQ